MTETVPSNGGFFPVQRKYQLRGQHSQSHWTSRTAPYTLQSNLLWSANRAAGEKTWTKIQTNFLTLSLPWAARPSSSPLRSLSHPQVAQKSHIKQVTICLPLQPGDTSLGPWIPVSEPAGSLDKLSARTEKDLGKKLAWSLTSQGPRFYPLCQPARPASPQRIPFKLVSSTPLTNQGSISLLKLLVLPLIFCQSQGHKNNYGSLHQSCAVLHIERKSCRNVHLLFHCISLGKYWKAKYMSLGYLKLYIRTR